MRFTDSPFEKMMKQKPRPQAPAPAKPPRGSRCSGCSYWRHRLCVLLPGAHAGPGWREVTAWPVN